MYSREYSVLGSVMLSAKVNPVRSPAHKVVNSRTPTTTRVRSNMLERVKWHSFQADRLGLDARHRPIQPSFARALTDTVQHQGESQEFFDRASGWNCQITLK
ncbi:uncharacterized protein PV07_10768 [Cladophialophora immunda]|uniref:Uncharacterized protein n=1 Tax=Cladophialophora immunda TaxID=569365 RepID=A0A0D2C1C1_9EURO|nr:uncharacterized protein PV07_10768 [Cladophialophora immunda]KIW25103.1 hypothetical protein PV07_10768 [Cladophialophora immunda]